ncbi:MAG: N-acetyltransferase [Bacillota bacterium]
MAYHIVNIGDYLESFGEQEYKMLVADFSCPDDKDIERFLKDKAVLFHKQGITRTFLVFSSDEFENVLVGYFAIAIKSLHIAKDVSQSLRRILTGTKSNAFMSVPVFLIGQLAKNYCNSHNRLVEGKTLLKFALDYIFRARVWVGGRIVLVECADIGQLHKFYSDNGFRRYETDSEDGLIRYIMKIEDN